jgi:hypothetical protein
MIQGLLDLASAFGLSTSAGLNAYIPMLVVALLARFTSLIHLDEPWDLLTNGWVIALLGVLLIIEEFADKIPVVDTVNDIIQTLIRPTAGAIVFAATTQSSINMHPVLALACGVILAGTVHVVKTGSRPVVAAASGGLATPVVSTIEDLVVTVVSFLSIIFPFLVALWLLLLGVVIFMVLSWRYRRRSHRLGQVG